MTIRKKKKFKSIISTFLCLALLGGAVFGVTKLLKTDSDTVEIKASAFAVGALDEDGKSVENKQTLYTKKMFRCDGLTVKLDDDCLSSYQIFFYNYFGDFIKSTDVLSEDYELDPESAYPAYPNRDTDKYLKCGYAYAKIMVTPAIPEGENVTDFKISFFEKAKFLEGISITVDNNQDDGNIIDEVEEGIKYDLDTDSDEVLEIEDEKYSGFTYENRNLVRSYVKNVGTKSIVVICHFNYSFTKFIIQPGEILQLSDGGDNKHDGADSAYISFESDQPTPILYIV